MSKIEWTDETWNPVTGCTEVSPGCDHCYAARIARGRMRNRYLEGQLADGQNPADPFSVRLWPERLEQPLHWKKPRMIFVNSMSDLFHKAVSREYIAKIFDVMERADWHTYQILTKRPARAAMLLPQLLGPTVLRHHIWLGTSIESQDRIYRFRQLMDAPASVTFLSCEPLLGPLDFYDTPLQFVDWVIVGGESGPGARPMRLEWARKILNDCRAFNVAVFVKQLGSEWGRGHIDTKGGNIDEWPEDLQVREWPDVD